MIMGYTVSIKIRLRENHIKNGSYLHKEIIHWLDKEFEFWYVEYNRDNSTWWLYLAENKHAVHFRMIW